MIVLRCVFVVSPTDGSQLVAGVGNRVLVYDAVDGDLQNALKGHKVSFDYWVTLLNHLTGSL